MSMENNDKYIARSWIDDGTEEGFKKSFLESLLNQWQGEGNGFNADKLDGKHYCEIINDIDQKVEGLIPAFQIGNVHINRDTILSHDSILKIGFDGVQLNIPDEDGYDKYQKLPWDDEGVIRSGEPDLLKAFQELYDIVKEKLDADVYNTYITQNDENIFELQDFKSDIDTKVIRDDEGNFTGLDASSLNGIRIFIKTQEQYDQLKEDYPEVISDPHNLFIINEGEEISDEILAHQPGTQPLAYYEFQKVARDEEDENGNIITVYYLQYKHQDATVWHDIGRTSDFIDDDAIIQKFLKALDENPNYTLNESSFNRSLKEVDVNDGSDYSIPNYIRWSGIRDLTCSKYNIDIPTTPDKNDSSSYGQPRTADLSNLVNKIEEVIDSKIEAYMDKIYPKDCIYITLDNKNPREILGVGNWEKISGRFLVGSGQVTDSRDETRVFDINSPQGGEINHKLSISEIPSHRHNHNHLHNPSKSNGGFLWSDNKDIAINLSAKHKWTATTTSGGTHFVYTNYNNGGIDQILSTVGDVKNNYPYTDQWTQYEGGSNPIHNNLPPYQVVHIWRRVS